MSWLEDHHAEPVHNAEAEKYLIGAVLGGYADLDTLSGLVHPADFYLPVHEELWKVMLRLHRAGTQPVAFPVQTAMASEKVRGYDPLMLLDYLGAVPLVADAEFYARTIRDAAGLRRIQAAGVRVTQIGATPGMDLVDAQALAQKTVDEATRTHIRTKARSLADLIPAAIDTAEHGQHAVLSTGWGGLDHLIGGWAPGRLVVIGARPGVGKSVFGTNAALHMAGEHDHAVLIASLEMPETEVTQRLLAAYANANLTNLQTGRTTEEAWGRIAERTGSLSALPITVDDNPNQSVHDIHRTAVTMQRTRDDLALIVVDYLQLVRPTDTRAGNRAEQLGEISRGLKLMARDTGTCVIAMAQVNREGAKHKDGRPRMTDLRESGSIEADADQVILLHAPQENGADIEAIVDKNRHGPKDVVHMRMQGNYARLTERPFNPAANLA